MEPKHLLQRETREKWIHPRLVDKEVMHWGCSNLWPGLGGTSTKLKGYGKMESVGTGAAAGGLN